ncbi:phage tail tape measure protein, partial [Escherichia coli]|uniref:phage tail tape measure protein n=1 Tax=Escherichia coli TaxID=562 RepID=UPI0039BE855E
ETQSSMAEVARTVGLMGAESSDALGNLQDELIQLSQSMPTSFTDLADIAATAGQLGVAEEYIVSFTETVAQFSATTDVSV